MHPFTFTSATDAASAARIVGAEHDAKFVAGGTTLIDLMKLDVETPAHLVDIGPLRKSDPALARVTPLPDGGLRIGALVLNSDLAWDTQVRERYPMLSEALLAGASGQIRNMATVGGNLLQRTRCYYFRDTATPCNKRKPGSGCSAMDGFNRMHAVLGTSDYCIAANPSDMSVAMVALDAIVRVRGPRGERTIPIVDFHLVPGAHPEHETLLQHGELITAVDLPAISFAQRSHYLKVRDRASYAFALASAAVALDVQGGVIRGARIAMGGVGTKPWRSAGAERALIGKPTADASYRAAAEIALSGAVTHKYNGFKVPLAKRTLVRALATAAAIA